MAWWDGAGADRLAHDREIVAEVQPGLRHEIQPDSSMALVGDFLVTTRSGAEHRIPTTLKFPADYPAHEPSVHEPSTRFPHEPDRHFYQDSDQCCLWLDVESQWDPTDPNALRVILDQLLTFYHRQLMMEAGVVDVFPGPQRGHGGFGYLDYLKDVWGTDDATLRRLRFAIAGKQEPKSACPCGSGRQYRRCHLGAVTRFRQKASPFTLGQLVSMLGAMPMRTSKRERLGRTASARLLPCAGPGHVTSANMAHPSALELTDVDGIAAPTGVEGGSLGCDGAGPGLARYRSCIRDNGRWRGSRPPHAAPPLRFRQPTHADRCGTSCYGRCPPRPRRSR